VIRGLISWGSGDRGEGEKKGGVTVAITEAEKAEPLREGLLLIEIIGGMSFSTKLRASSH